MELGYSGGRAVSVLCDVVRGWVVQWGWGGCISTMQCS